MKFLSDIPLNIMLAQRNITTSLRIWSGKPITTTLQAKVAPEGLRSLCYLLTIYAQLIDSILVTNKVVDDCNRRNHEGIVFKLDLDKAYSRFSWSFKDVL